MKKSILSLVLIFALLLSMPVSASALNDEVSTVSSAEETAFEFVMEIPVLHIDDYEPGMDLTPFLEDAGISASATDYMTTIVDRNGGNRSCEVILQWTGDTIYNGFCFTSCTLKSTSILFPEIYGSIGDGVNFSYFWPIAAVSGTISLGNIDVPTNVTQVRVAYSNFSAYDVSKAAWMSGLVPSYAVNII